MESWSGWHMKYCSCKYKIHICRTLLKIFVSPHHKSGSTSLSTTAIGVLTPNMIYWEEKLRDRRQRRKHSTLYKVYKVSSAVLLCFFGWQPLEPQAPAGTKVAFYVISSSTWAQSFIHVKWQKCAREAEKETDNNRYINIKHWHAYLGGSFMTGAIPLWYSGTSQPAAS